MKRLGWAIIARGWWEYFPGDESNGTVCRENDGWYSYPKGHEEAGPFQTATMAMRDVERLKRKGETDG
ncbi:hypothetical protein LCGC14_1113730 [marine sediment metagenome]|uniref:Uncharacterized protein n=1 Tax=marine sediment metagenome TaxID=412755 RepID=A0A0F9MAT3_9ZZZZ